MFSNEEQCLNNSQIVWILAIIGFLFTIKLILWLLYNLWIGFKTFILPKLGKQEDFINKYGHWAVVTGSTDGVGKAYAMELAKRGMNICLISRDVNKLQETAKQIETQHDVETMWIQADFSKTDIYDNIKDKLSDLEIGILVNNVGIAMECPELFIHESSEFLWRILNVNIGATVMMTSIILPGLIQRKKGLIVNMSSQSGEFPVPLMSMYASTKAFMNMFSTCLGIELENENVRVQCLLGGWIDTKLLGSYSGLLSLNRHYLPWIMPSARKYAKSAVNTISTNNNYTCGYWIHSFFMVCGQYVSNRYIQAIIARAMVSFQPK